MQRFRRAVEARDLAEMTQSLAEDVVFESPIVFKRYVGREAVGFILGAVMTVFEDFRYVSELHGDGETALVFTARVSTPRERSRSSRCSCGRSVPRSHCETRWARGSA
jgi:ketosteroid isomerase-like protein